MSRPGRAGFTRWAIPAAGIAALTLSGLLVAHVGSGIAVDAQGRVYFIDTARNVLWRVDQEGRRTAVAEGVHGDDLVIGPDGAPVYQPDDVAVLTSVPAVGGITYRVHGHRIFRIGPDGGDAPLAGDAEAGYRDGVGAEARFRRPLRLALDSVGNVFVADYGNHRVRKVTPAGVVSTVALVSWPWWPTGIAIWRDRIYVLERWGDYYRLPPVPGVLADLIGHPRIRMITSDGQERLLSSVVRWRTRVGAALVLLAIGLSGAWWIRRTAARLRAASRGV